MNHHLSVELHGSEFVEQNLYVFISVPFQQMGFLESVFGVSCVKLVHRIYVFLMNYILKTEQEYWTQCSNVITV